MSKLQILHISDLHISEDENFDRSVVLDPMIERVGQDKKSGFKPEIVVVTGDIANIGVKTEYDLAKSFFDSLLGKLDLSNERLFIVPGNHDVNRKKYRKSDIPKYETMKELNEELENEDDRADLLKGMEDYFHFIKSHYPHLKSKHGILIPFVCSYKAECGKKTGLVGLNSAWMCRKSPDEKEIAIGEYQTKNAMKELKENGNYDLVINIFHHPLNWLWPEDMKKCRHYFNNTHLLSGHLHEPEGSFIRNSYGNYCEFQAGGAYLGSDSLWPSRFYYLTFDWEKKHIRLDFRKFVKERSVWCLDAETGADGKKIFELLTIDNEDATEGALETPEPRPKIPESYLTWLSENYAYMDADKLYGKGQAIPLSLPEIFIPLYADKLLRIPKKDKIEIYEKQEDIEELIGKNEYLLIEGHPGSGKSTLLKHVAYSLSQGKNVKGLEAYLPVLMPLKKLESFFKEQDSSKKSLPAEDILKHYFQTIENVIDLKTIQKFSKAKKTLLLLDGLDEIDVEYREIVVNAFADYRVKNKGIKVVFTGRPHGIEGAALNRFGKNHMKILPLNMD